MTHLKVKSDKEEFLSRLRGNKDLFRRLKDLLDTLNETNKKGRISLQAYDKPSWSEFQADSNGYERALTEVLSLLKFTKD